MSDISFYNVILKADSDHTTRMYCYAMLGYLTPQEYQRLTKFSFHK